MTQTHVHVCVHVCACNVNVHVCVLLGDVLPSSRETVGIKRHHISQPSAMKHNADPIIREHFSVLDCVFEYLTETLRVSVTYELVTEEFELELTKMGITWQKNPDADKDHKLKVGAVYNYLHKHKRSDKKAVVARRAKRKSHTMQEKAAAVALHQQVIRDAISKHNITSYDSFYNEDETFFTKNGCLTRRSLGYTGHECIVTEPTSHKDGFMFLTTVSHARGVVFYHFKPASEKRWQDESNRYKVDMLRPRVYSILVNPSGKISQVTFLNTLAQIHRLPSPGAPMELVDYDNAGPHSGRLIELALKSMHKVPTHGPLGGATDIDQVCDTNHIHGSLKEAVRRKARRKFLEDSKRLHREGKKTKPPGLNLHTLAAWMSEWAEAHGKPEDVHHSFEQCFPPPLGKPDLRKMEIKKHEALYAVLGDPPPKRKKVARKDMPLTALKQIGKARGSKITELTGIKTVGELANADEKTLADVDVRSCAKHVRDEDDTNAMMMRT